MSSGSSASRTRGHAEHHVSYLHEDGTLYAGDAAGVRLAPDAFVFAPSAPPEVDIQAWETTLDVIENHDPARLAITHFGVFDDVAGHLQRLRATMRRWAGWVADGADEATFVAAAADGSGSGRGGRRRLPERRGVRRQLRRARAVLAETARARAMRANRPNPAR